ncbi:histidine kinase [Luteimonas huabeiensis]|uniref:sensor histidine kinase n=1 Tax=Luteimonas huabeiensis TaxID=1244513 RepID=UPI0009DE4C77
MIGAGAPARAPGPQVPPPTFPRRFSPAPDSRFAVSRRHGRPPWADAIHLLWSAWVFVVPMFSPHGYDLRWALLTALSYPLFLALFAGSLLASQTRVRRYALGMIALCLALLPWYPSGLSYFVFGCVLLGAGGWRSVWAYLGALLLLNALLLLWARGIGYPWSALAWLPVTTLVIGLIVQVERRIEDKDAALRLSHEEVRRLAALAERERIGRDLHDLLGHTLSMVALKSDLAARLLARDPEAARHEIAEVGRAAREALVQVRGAVSGIRAAGLAGELAAARLLLETSGIAFDYRIGERFAERALTAEAESALALAVREAATNIQRHAGARRAEAVLAVEGGEAVLRIADDGRGGAIVPGNGLSGMRERLEALRGSLRIEAGPGRGTRLLARVPLAADGA